MMLREPAVAGSFYPAAPDDLLRQLALMTDLKSERKRVWGALCPHAGYAYSGKIAGRVYSMMEPADTYIILGPNHHGFGGEFSIMLDGTWNTPLGDVYVNDLIAKKIFVNSGLVEENFFAHQKEHSIEVQLPFLQYIGDDFSIVPIALKHYLSSPQFLDSCMSMAQTIADTVKSQKSRVALIASTDFTHYEPQETAVEKDGKALEAVGEMNPQMLFETVAEYDVSMCGYGAVAVVMEACRLLGAEKTRIIGYQTSGDVTGDKSQVVGYGGALFI